MDDIVVRLRDIRTTHADASEAADEIDRLRAEVAQWKANHDNQVRIKRTVMDRPDLGERAKLVKELIAERDAFKQARDNQIQSEQAWHDERDAELVEMLAAHGITTYGVTGKPIAEMFREHTACQVIGGIIVGMQLAAGQKA